MLYCMVRSNSCPCIPQRLKWRGGGSSGGFVSVDRDDRDESDAVTKWGKFKNFSAFVSFLVRRLALYRYLIPIVFQDAWGQFEVVRILSALLSGASATEKEGNLEFSMTVLFVGHYINAISTMAPTPNQRQ